MKPLHAGGRRMRASVFVAANAGSGKTSTLVRRVARLLLRGAKPEAILCVTYTKAAAAEMAIRVTDEAMQACGGAAYSRHLPLERNLRDARAAAIMASSGLSSGTRTSCLARSSACGKTEHVKRIPSAPDRAA